MAKPASKINLTILLITISELELRMDKRFGGILRALRKLSRFRRSEQRDGQWKSKCWRSQILSLVCRVHIGESFRPSLWAWSGKSEWPTRRRLKRTIVDLGKFRLLNQILLLEITGAVFLYLEAKPMGKLFHWLDQTLRMWRRKGGKNQSKVIELEKVGLWWR